MESARTASQVNAAPVSSLPSPGRAGMFGLIAAESAVFVIFVVAYAFYLGKSASGPTPSILKPPLFLSACLLSSSATLELALHSLKRGAQMAFSGWWLLTLLLGVTFLVGTGFEWRHLIVEEGLTISTNLFGTTYYALVGLHAAHVTIGLLLMATVAVFDAKKQVTRARAPEVGVISLYWHFVDSVWVVVFTLVYVVGR
jgi:cytochrome c oxidase subunit III